MQKKDKESWQKNNRDKIKSPQPNKTKTSNFEQFQKTTKLVLKAQMPNTKMLPTPNKEPSKEAAVNIITITPNNKKKLTTIFPRKKELTMTKKKGLVDKEFPRVEEITASDEELLEATKVIEREEEEKIKQKEGAKYKVVTVEAGRDALTVKPTLDAERTGARPKVSKIVVKEGAKYKVVTFKAGRDAMAVKPSLEAERTGARPKVAKIVVTKSVTEPKPANQKNDSSDEEFLQATLELEHLQLEDHAQEEALHVVHHQGGDHQDAKQPEEGVQGAQQVPDPELPLRMMQSHPDRNQGLREGHHSQARHGPGDHPVGGGHHHVRDQGEEVDHQHQEEATGVPGSPPPSLSPARSQRTPPNSRMTPEVSRKRIICTPLWKRKSMLRRSSLSTGKKKKPTSTSTPSKPSTARKSPDITSNTTTARMLMSTSTEKTSPGSKLPRNVTNIGLPLHEQSMIASTSDRPTDVAGNPDQPMDRKQRMV